MNSQHISYTRLLGGLVLGGFVLFSAPVAGKTEPVKPAPIKTVVASAAVKPKPAAAMASAPKDPAPGNITEMCTALTQRVSDIDAELCAEAALRPSGAKSVRGVPIFHTDVMAPRPTADTASGTAAAAAPERMRRRVLVIGAIHGDEISSAALAFHWLRLAKETAGQIEWRFVPVLNPDGMFMAKPQRMNANGVDLNRNFPTPNWQAEAPAYWESRTKRDPRRYPGAKPLSEPESRWLYDEMERFKPNLIVSIHAPYGVLDFDGPTVPPQRLGRLYLDQVGIYPGSLGNYGGVHKRVPVVTIELNNAHRTPTSIEMRQMWLDMLRWIGERLPE